MLLQKGKKTLINHKKYHYLAIAYAYNEFMLYDQNNADTYEGQKKPFLAGRKGVGGGIKKYVATPHIVAPEKGRNSYSGSVW